jgi:SAM-dependent methyltransferase
MTVKCIVCGETTTKKLCRTWDRHYGIPGQFDVVACTSCGLLHLDPMPTDKELAGYYSSGYYSFKPVQQANWKTTVSRLFWREPIPTHDPPFGQPGEFLDVGCGSGAYLQKMLACGWPVRGVEPGSEGAKNGAEAGLDIFNGTLLEAQYPDNSFDYIRSNHSFEHMTNPVETLAEMFRVMRPGGKGFIGVPNVDSLPYRVFGRYWWFFGAPLHTYGYSPTTLSTLLRSAGFSVDHVYYNSNYASVCGSLQIFINRKQTSGPASSGRILRNYFLRLVGTLLARLLDLLHQGDAIEVIFSKPA